MNIFYLHHDPKINAQYHVDKHIVKMCIEYAQLLSTAHRLLDGNIYTDKTKNNRNIKRWNLEDHRECLLYKASHINHPSNIWARQSTENYKYLFLMYISCLQEYTHRYGKIHGSQKLEFILSTPPNNIKSLGITPIPQCMPEYCKIANDSISAYRKYYISEKNTFAYWTNRTKPDWYNI
jgi:hypothetical protein|tara:strand:- start:325 stop:861 length:537 start_codon:yes stop_codon:yes gene_type:complete